MLKLSLHHFAAACSLLLLVALLSACGGGEPQGEANAFTADSMIAASQSSEPSPADEPTPSPPAQLMEELEKGARLNAQDLQAAQTLATMPALSKVAPADFEKAT
ncbi:MAG TPA: hypothetical protein VIN35_11170, partial [Hydrogenophaga sp.]